MGWIYNFFKEKNKNFQKKANIKRHIDSGLACNIVFWSECSEILLQITFVTFKIIFFQILLKKMQLKKNAVPLIFNVNANNSINLNVNQDVDINVQEFHN